MDFSLENFTRLHNLLQPTHARTHTRAKQFSKPRRDTAELWDWKQGEITNDSNTKKKNCLINVAVNCTNSLGVLWLRRRRREHTRRMMRRKSDRKFLNPQDAAVTFMLILLPKQTSAIRREVRLKHPMAAEDKWKENSDSSCWRGLLLDDNNGKIAVAGERKKSGAGEKTKQRMWTTQKQTH